MKLEKMVRDLHRKICNEPTTPDIATYFDICLVIFEVVRKMVLP